MLVVLGISLPVALGIVAVILSLVHGIVHLVADALDLWRTRGGLVVARPPITNPYWLVPHWWIDPANSTTCASDTNTCTSATCGGAGSGIGPCVTYAEIAAGRWSTYAPRLNQNTIITFLSSQPNGSDPVIAKPITNGAVAGNTGVVLTIETVPTVVSSGVFAGLVAKNRATNTPMQITISAPAINNLLNDTTRSSSAWVEVAGTPATPSQPISGISLQNGPITSITAMAEDNGWTNGDSYTQTAPQKVVLSQLIADTTLCLQQEVCGIAVNNLYVLEPATSNFGDDALYVGQLTWMANVYSERLIKVVGTGAGYGSDQVASGMVNVGMFGFGGGLGIPSYRNAALPHGYSIYGGYIRSQAQSCVFNGVFIDFDFHVMVAVSGGPKCYFMGYNYLGAMRIDATAVNLGVLDMRSFVQNASTNVMWGTGGGGFDTTGQVLYPAGGGAAAAAFLTTSNPKILGGTVGCLGVPSVALPVLTCNKTVSAANLDTDLGATTGCYYVAGSGAYCNSGP